MLISEINYKQAGELLLDFERPLSQKLIRAINACMFSGISDSGENGDCILVLGSKNGVKRRIPKAISLFRDNRAKHILVTGGTQAGDGMTEAELYEAALIENDVPSTSIFVENFSRNTPENMMFAKKIIEEKIGSKIVKLIVVTNNFHMKRAVLTAKKYFPDDFIFIPSGVEDSCASEGVWHATERGRKRIERELRSLVISIANGWAADEEFEGAAEDFEQSDYI